MLVKDYRSSLQPLEKLTKDDIKSMTIHHSLPSLKRAASHSPYVARVEGTDKIPTLYYIKKTYTDECDWELHALSEDINKFILNDIIAKDSSSDSEEPEEKKEEKTEAKEAKKSTIALDEVKKGKATSTDSEGSLVVSGEIPHFAANALTSDNEEGNYVVMDITPGEGNMENFPDATIESNDLGIAKTPIKTYLETQPLGKGDGNVIHVIKKIETVGESYTVILNWDKPETIKFGTDAKATKASE